MVRIKSQYCLGIPQYDQCSSNSMCACFHEVNANGTALCLNRFVTCSQLVACDSSNNYCFKPNHQCLHHPQCNNRPVCYPVPSFNKQLCPIMTSKNAITMTYVQKKRLKLDLTKLKMNPLFVKVILPLNCDFYDISVFEFLYLIFRLYFL